MLASSRSLPSSIRSIMAHAHLHRMLLAVILLALCVLPGRAQVTATLLPTQITLPEPAAGLLTPQCVGVDKAGNVYILDSGNNDIVEISAAGVVSTITPSGGGIPLKNPQGMAVCSDGNIYIADTGNNRLLYVQGGTPNTNAIWNQPTGITVNQSSSAQGGSLFITNAGNSTVVEMPGTGACESGWGGIPALVTTTGLSNPTGIAVDLNQNVYIADTGNGRLVELPNGQGGGSQTTVTTSGLLTPQGVAVDANNNVYVSDGTNNNAIELNMSGGSPVQSTVSSSNLSTPQGLAIDAFGDVYIADTGHKRVVEENIALSRNLGQVAVGGFGDPAVLNYSISGYTGGDYTPTIQLTYGKDVALGTPSCTGGTSPETCTIPVTLQPALPGARADAVQVVAPGGGPMLTDTLVYGVGNGPQGIFASSAANIVPTTGLSNQSYGITVDRLGNIFVSDGSNTDILEVNATTGTQTTLPITGLYFPMGIALDGAGDLYIADYSNAGVDEVPANGGAMIYISPKLNGQYLIYSPSAVAVDGAGNLYIADPGASQVEEVSSTGIPSVLDTNLNGPSGIALDGMGNLYIADTGNNRVVEIALGSNTTSVVNTSSLSTPLNAPQSVVVDAAGDIYVADSGNNRIVEIAAGGGASVLNTGSLTAPSGSACSSTPLCDPTGLALDGKGNLFINDTTNSRVVEISPTAAPSLTFPSTNTGSSSTQQVVTLANIGNQPLTFTTLDTTTTGQTSSSFNLNGAGTTCTTTTPLAPGNICGLGVEFAPLTAGSLTGTVNITDNNLNAPAPDYAMQQISVSGTGTGYAATIALSASPGTTVVAGTPITVTATLSGGNGTPTGSISYTLDGANPQTVALASGVAQFTIPGTLSAGSHSVTVSYAGDVDYTNSTSSQSLNIMVSATASTTTTMLTSSASIVVYGQSVTLTATVTDPNGPVVSGTVTFASGTTSIGAEPLGTGGTAVLTTTLLPVGTDNITATFVATANDATSTSTPAVVVTVTAATPPPPTPAVTTTTLVSSASSVVYGQSVTLTATVTDPNGPVVSGTVTFASGTTSIGAAQLGAGGTAALTTTLLPVGTDNITATFVATANDATSTSTPAVPVTVTAATTPPTPSITITASSTTLSVAPGATITDTLTITPVGGYTGALQFACTGLPINTTCNFSPTTLTLTATSTAQTVTLTVQTNVVAQNFWQPLAPGQMPNSPSGSLPMLATVFWMPGWLLASVPGLRKKTTSANSARARHLLVLLILLAGVGMMTACGGSSAPVGTGTSTPPGPVTPAGPATVQVVVTGPGNLAQTLTINLTVQ